MEHDAIISCKLCKLTLDISVDMKDGDLFWSLFENDFQKQSTANLSSALDMYRSAMEKLKSADMEFLTGSFESLKTSCGRDCIIPSDNEVCNSGKTPLAFKDDMIPPCSVCVLLRQASVDHCNDPTILKDRRKNSRNAEAGPSLNVAKRISRNSSCSAKEMNAQTRTRSSKRTAHGKGDKGTLELTCKSGISCCDELPACALVFGESECFPGNIDNSKNDLCNLFGCWKCLLTKSLNSGCIQNILQFRWDRVRQRYLVSVLLKIGTSFKVPLFCRLKI